MLKKHIICCIPLSWGFVARHFFISCLRMKNHSIKNGYKLTFVITTSCYLDEARDNLVKLARDTGAEYFLWLDADQTYPQATPDILLSHMNNGKLVVGGCTPKRDSGIPLVYRRKGTKYFFTNPRLNQGMIKVDAMGMGGVMTHRSVFDKMKPPYFMMRWENDAYVGEDIRFYDKCYEVGIDVWCDTDLEYGHLDIKPVHLIKAG